MATHSQILTINQVSTDVVTKLTEFQLGVYQALSGRQNPGLIGLGASATTSALSVKMPVAVGTPVFQLLINGLKYQQLGKLMLPLSFKEYAAGIAALVKILQADDWQGWGDAPGQTAEASMLIGEAALADGLQTGESTPSVENYLDGDTTNTTHKIFGKNKPVDPLGGSSATYTNLYTGGNARPRTLNNVDEMWKDIKTIKHQDGVNYRDLVWKYVLCGPDIELKARRYFEEQGTANDKIVEQSGSSTAEVEKTNTAKKHKIEVISSPYLTTPGAWYPVCVTQTLTRCPWAEYTQIPANTPPFIGQFPNLGGGVGLEWIIDDLTSELYKHGSKEMGLPPGYVAIAAKRNVGVGITAPWQIFKCLPT